MSPAWAAMLRCAVALGLAPEAFWRLSLAEWRALSADPALPGLSRAAFEGLAARYPDDRHG